MDDVYERRPDEQPRQELDHPVIPLVEVGITSAEQLRALGFDCELLIDWREVIGVSPCDAHSAGA